MAKFRVLKCRSHRFEIFDFFVAVERKEKKRKQFGAAPRVPGASTANVHQAELEKELLRVAELRPRGA